MEQELFKYLLVEENKQLEKIKNIKDSCSLLDYKDLSKNNIWTKALQKAINEHEKVIIPFGSAVRNDCAAGVGRLRHRHRGDWP